MQKHELHLRPQTSLFLRYQMRQALKVLELSHLDLQNYIQEEIEKNPLLKYDLPLIGSSENLDSFSDTDESFTESLDFQVRILAKNQRQLSMYFFLIQNTDSRGFLTCNVEKLVKASLYSQKELLIAQKQLQNLEPHGICFENLQEYFLFHLEKKQKKNSLCYQIIRDSFGHFENENWSYFKKIYDLNQLELINLFKNELQDMIPKVFHSEKKQDYRPVDIYYIQNENGWEIQYNRKNLPTLYLEKKMPTKSLQQEYLRGKNLIDHLIYREQNLMRFATYFLKEQQLFFENCSDFIPLFIQNCAKELNVHPSTVFRLIQGKSFSCPKGIFSFRDGFCNSKLQNQVVNKHTMEKLLKKFVEQENKETPLTDIQLMKKLEEYKIPCSRRTVTKYRKKLRISSARKRKIFH